MKFNCSTEPLGCIPAKRKKDFTIKRQTEVVMTLDQPESELRVKEEWDKKENNMGRGLNLNKCQSFVLGYQRGDLGTQTSMRPQPTNDHTPMSRCSRNLELQGKNTFLKSKWSSGKAGESEGHVHSDSHSCWWPPCLCTYIFKDNKEGEECHAFVMDIHCGETSGHNKGKRAGQGEREVTKPAFKRKRQLDNITTWLQSLLRLKRVFPPVCFYSILSTWKNKVSSKSQNKQAINKKSQGTNKAMYKSCDHCF